MVQIASSTFSLNIQFCSIRSCCVTLNYCQFQSKQCEWYWCLPYTKSLSETLHFVLLRVTDALPRCCEQLAFVSCSQLIGRVSFFVQYLQYGVTSHRQVCQVIIFLKSRLDIETPNVLRGNGKGVGISPFRVDQEVCGSIVAPNRAPAENKMILMHFIPGRLCLQCFDAVGWAAGRASGL